MKKTGSGPLYRVPIFYGEKQTQTKENKLTISDSGNTTKETKWANVIECDGGMGPPLIEWTRMASLGR